VLGDHLCRVLDRVTGQTVTHKLRMTPFKGNATLSLQAKHGNAMRIAAEIGQNRLGAAEGRFGIDHPFGFAERGEPGFECGRLGQSGMVTEENEVPGVVQGEQAFDEQAAKEP